MLTASPAAEGWLWLPQLLRTTPSLHSALDSLFPLPNLPGSDVLGEWRLKRGCHTLYCLFLTDQNLLKFEFVKLTINKIILKERVKDDFTFYHVLLPRFNLQNLFKAFPGLKKKNQVIYLIHTHSYSAAWGKKFIWRSNVDKNSCTKGLSIKGILDP